MLRIPFKTGNQQTDDNFSTIQRWVNWFSSGAFEIDSSQVDDMQIGAAVVRPAATAPSLDVWVTSNGTDLRTWDFRNGADEGLEIQMQMSHQWKTGTEYGFHVHFSPSTNMTAGQTVVWELDYTRANINGTFTDGTLTLTYTANGTETTRTHCMTNEVKLSGTGYNASHILVGTLWRRATTDTYNGGVFYHSADFHIEKNKLGYTFTP